MRVALLLAPVVVLALLIGLRSHQRGPDPSACLAAVDDVSFPPFAEVVHSDKRSLRVREDQGREFTLPRRPARIASLLPGITEMVAYLGGLPQLVAVSLHCDTPDAVQALTRLSVMPLSVERLLETKPDLVVLDRRLHRNALDDVAAQGVPVLVLETSRTLDDLEQSFVLLAKVLDTATAMERAQAWTRALERLRAAIAPAHRMPPERALVVAQWEPLYVTGPGGLLHAMVSELGFINVACDLPGDASGPYATEVALARAPQWILSPSVELPARVAGVWSATPAIKKQHVVQTSGNIFARGGPWSLLALEELALRMLGLERPAGESARAVLAPFTAQVGGN